MVQSFGKKRKSRKSRKVAVKKSTMYCIKRTKVGKRVVKVEVVQKGKKVVRKYASTKRALGKNVKCFRTKTQAKASLRSLKSSFGSRSGSKSIKKKTIRPYGFVACNDHENVDDGFKKFRVYKFYPIKFNYESYKIVVHKDKYTGEVKAFHVPYEAKTYRVKTSGSDLERKASEKLAKARANKKARDYETLGAVGVGLDLIECDSKQLATVSSAPGAPPGLKGLSNFQQSIINSRGQISLKDAKRFMEYSSSSQLEKTIAKNNMNSLLNTNGVRIASNTGNMYNMFTKGSPHFTRDGRLRAITDSNREVTVSSSSTRNLSNNQPYHGGGFGRSLFGRRVNYGFSKYF